MEKIETKFKKLKRKRIRNFYANFLKDLKQSSPGKFFTMAKRIGALDQMADGELQVECLSDSSNQEAAETIANFFAEVSNEYDPVNFTQLPSFLPAEKPPQVSELQVYEKIKKLKNTKSTSLEQSSLATMYCNCPSNVPWGPPPMRDF